MIEFLKTAFNTRKRLLIAALWLFALSFLVSNFFSYRTSLSRARNEVEDQLQESQERFHLLLKDTALLFALHEGNYDAGDPPPVYNEPFAFFLYSLNDIGNPILSFWNSHVVEPLHEDVGSADGSRLVKYQSGYFVIEKHTLNNRGSRLIVMALFPIKWDYFLENRYLRSDFVALKGAGKIYEISASTSHNVVRDLHGKSLFSLINTENKSVHRYDNISIVLWILGTVLLFFYLNGVAANINNDAGLLKATGFLTAVIIIYRLLTIYIPFPFDFKKLELFDPSIYASSEMLPSLGDLMMNSLLLFWLVAFIKGHFLKRSTLSFQVSEKQAWIVNTVVSAILVLAAYLLADIVQSLVEDSQISFDVMDFFSMNIYTVTSFFVLTLLLLTFYHASHILLHLVSLLPAIDQSYRLLLTGVIGLVVLVVSPFNTANSVNVIVLGWLILYLYILQQRRHDWSRPLIRSSMFIFWIMFFSFSVTAILIYQNQRTEKAARKSTAEKLAIQTDPSGENLMSIAITNLDDGWLTQNFYRFRFEQPNDFLKDSLITENFAGYLNKFDTRIYTYDSVFNQLYNEDTTTSYAKIKSLMVTYCTPTNTPGLVYYENTPDKFSYIYEKQVKGVNGNTAGYIFIYAKPKRYKSEALYPELFNQSEGGPAELGTNYAYAVYSNGRLINSYNDFNFARELSPRQYPMLEMEWRTNNDRSELWYKASSNKLVVVVKKNSTAIEGVTLFAYFFFTFLFIVLLFHAGRYLVASNFNWRTIWAAASLSIRNQIHLTIIFISLFSFIIIGIATISFFVIRFNKANNERLGRTVQVMANELEARINRIKVADDQITLEDLGITSDLDKALAEVSDIHNVDVNLYSPDGQLRLSTIPYLYNKGIMNRRMDPYAFFQMHHNRRAEWLQEENVGNFSYLSIYVPIRSESEETFAYLNIPYLNSQRELNEEISNFLVTLINLNAFIFLLAGAIAFFLANKITSSFSIITAKMREVNLGRVNEEIVWKNRDEIGALVSEYNTMVQKLEASANALAKSEREGAWREMARQVAHEIKNPLTPMKLSIQHLQRAIDSGAPNVKELSERMAATLIEQIDQLAKIAADFSQFANIGNIRPEEVDVVQVLRSLIGLYSSDPKLQIHFSVTAAKTVIHADKTQVNRLFTNLIKNAIEASQESDTVNIYISVGEVQDGVLISIRDEGSGIPFDMQEKIFSPNFTTKSSGTGLGLAICKAIVEKANGQIWFETKEQSGTTFFISFPTHKP